MKGLTLTQPWATLVAIGAKRIETRSWSTHYRGPIAIHAAKKMPREARHLFHCAPFAQTFADARDAYAIAYAARALSEKAAARQGGTYPSTPTVGGRAA